MELELQANAKINLALDVLGERADGYHEIDMIMQEISLSDTISIEAGRGGFVLGCDDKSLKLDKNNLIYKAWDALRHMAENDSVVIELEKKIPMQAGLGGGSSDAAAVLKGLNKLWGLGLESDQLEEIGAGIGSDVPFFIKGGTQRAQGRGEKLTPLRTWYGKPLLLVNSGQNLSTAFVYKNVKIGGNIPVDEIAELLSIDSPKATDKMENRLEQAAIAMQGDIRDILREVDKAGAIKSMVSGSGPTVFGLFESLKELKSAHDKLKGKYHFVEMARTV